jgi:geranylgeranyl pyrophosphate synthase
MKSASTAECACHIGALLAMANQELIDTFSKFGHNLGMASQINNDMQGITQGTDIVNRKLTLPAIYALEQTDGEAHNQLRLAFSKQAEPAPDRNQTRDLLFRTGAIYYALIKMEFYKERALNILSEAERAGASVERLKLFLE